MVDFSVFEYCYRDGANYKAYGQLLLKGLVSITHIQTLQTHFESGEYFIAEQLGIPALYDELWALTGGPTADDHVWHTFHKLRPASSEETTAQVFDTARKLISKILAVRAWNQALSPHWDK